MKRSTLAELLFFVALVAVVYSPSTLSLGSSASPMTSSTGGLSHFISYLRTSGYHVEVANTSAQEASLLNAAKPALYVVIGADEALTSQEQQTIYNQYQSGSLSIIMAEGNKTNAPFISNYFGGDVTGAVITDHASAFTNQQEFYVSLELGGTTTNTFIDVASPLKVHRTLQAVAKSSSESTVSGSVGFASQIVAATSQDPAGGRAFFITTIAPFTNALMSPDSTSGGPNDTGAIAAIVHWALPSTSTGLVLVDNSHYNTSLPPMSPGLPVGLFGLILLDGIVSALATPVGVASSVFTGGTSFFGIPTIAISLAFALLMLAFVRGILKKYFASEKVIKDDQPVIPVEKQVLAESKERLDFVSTARSKSFYVATCAQLYEVMNDIANVEFATGLAGLSTERLTPRIGEESALRTMGFIDELTVLYDYATGKKRFLFPPVLSWKRKVVHLTTQAESLLNSLGMSMRGEGESKQLEYAIKR